VACKRGKVLSPKAAEDGDLHFWGHFASQKDELSTAENVVSLQSEGIGKDSKDVRECDQPVPRCLTLVHALDACCFVCFGTRAAEPHNLVGLSRRAKCTRVSGRERDVDVVEGG
jgi:hypothetical protein